MATYKVIQDIEAEDKLVGPLSLRQFIYAIIAAFSGYISFIALTKNAGFLLIIFVPIMLFTGFFAAPWGSDQPTEVWALAKIRFFIKPRRRIWDQSGIKNLVNITAPKVNNKNYTNGLSQIEVHSRLRALADTIDSRGWVIKNINANLYDPAHSPVMPDSDRLLNPSSLPQEVSPIDITASDDILDETNNPTAQNLDRLVQASYNTHHQQVIDQLRSQPNAPKIAPEHQLPPPADYWFLRQPINMPSSNNANLSVTQNRLITPGSEETDTATNLAMSPSDEKAIAQRLKANRKNLEEQNYQHMKVIQPIDPLKVNATQQSVSVTPPPDPAKMSLASRNDLDIATIGRIANKQDQQPDEVVISLHDHSS